jgi:signal transduction histidine kinase
MKHPIIILLLCWVSILQSQSSVELNEKAWSLRDISSDSCLVVAEMAVDVAISESDSVQLAKAISIKAGALHRLGRYDESLESNLRALDIREDLGNPEDIAKSLHQIGVYYRMRLIESISMEEEEQLKLDSTSLNLLEFSKSYFQRSLDLKIASGHDDYTSTMNNLGVLLQDGYMYSEAIDLFTEVYDLRIAQGDTTAAMDAAFNLAVTLDYLGQFEKARNQYRLASEYYEQQNLYRSMCQCTMNMAYSFEEENISDSTSNYYHLADSICAMASANDALEEVLYWGSHYFYENGNSKLGFEWLARYVDHLDSQDKALVNAVELEKDFELLKREQENNKLQLEIQERTISQQRLFITLLAILGLALIIISIMSRRRKKQVALSKMKEERIRELMRKNEIKSMNSFIEGQEIERKRIGQDMHDRLGSILSTMKMSFGSLDAKLGEQNEVRSNQFDKVNHLLDEAVKETRRISRNLISGVLSRFGLVAATKDLIHQVESAGDMDIEINTFGVEDRLDSLKEVHIYRILQELITNVVRHSKASKLIVTLMKKKGQFILKVHDNGIGFDLNQISGEGAGLNNIRGRTTTLGGELTIESGQNDGTKIEIIIPLNEEE